jgi:hypothetical protein
LNEHLIAALFKKVEAINLLQISLSIERALLSELASTEIASVSSALSEKTISFGLQ